LNSIPSDMEIRSTEPAGAFWVFSDRSPVGILRAVSVNMRSAFRPASFGIDKLPDIDHPFFAATGKGDMDHRQPIHKSSSAAFFFSVITFLCLYGVDHKELRMSPL
jgi:hypothetical protein